MIIGNEKSADILKKYINNVLETGKGTQFFVLVGPNGIGKISHAKQIIQEILGSYMYSDCLFVQDFEPFTGKVHTIPVEIKDDTKRYIEFPDGTQHENYGVREMNEWLINSSFSGKRFLLIENIQRMSNSAINAFLKSAEEPLNNRFIIATVPHISMVLDTIRSRSITIPFSELSNDEMKDFADKNNICVDDKDFQKMMISMAMGKPGFLKTLNEKILENEDMKYNLKKATKGLLDNSIPKGETFQSLKYIADQGFINDFLEGWIAYCCENGEYKQSEQWMKMKKYLQSNVNLDSVLLYGLLELG